MLPLFLLKRPKANLDELETILIKEFDLRKLENEEIAIIHGIGEGILKKEVTDFLKSITKIIIFFLGDIKCLKKRKIFIMQQQSDKPFSPNTLVVIVNNRDYKEYYSALKGYIDTEINNTTIDRIELYQKAIIKTEKGDIELELFPNEAPGTVENFEKLAKKGCP